MKCYFNYLCKYNNFKNKYYALRKCYLRTKEKKEKKEKK